MKFDLKSPVVKLSENHVEKACLDVLGRHHYWVKKLHAGTFRTADSKRWLKGVDKGTPDYVAVHQYYRGFLLEVKRPDGELSEIQEYRIQEIQICFHLAICVAYCIEDLIAWLAVHEQSP